LAFCDAPAGDGGSGAAIVLIKSVKIGEHMNRAHPGKSED
jgi:hypothetical protein